MGERQLIDAQLGIKPAAEVDYALDPLLVRMTAENLHSEIDAGSLKGNEVGLCVARCMMPLFDSGQCR